MDCTVCSRVLVTRKRKSEAQSHQPRALRQRSGKLSGLSALSDLSSSTLNAAIILNVRSILICIIPCPHPRSHAIGRPPRRLASRRAHVLQAKRHPDGPLRARTEQLRRVEHARECARRPRGRRPRAKRELARRGRDEEGSAVHCAASARRTSQTRGGGRTAADEDVERQEEHARGRGRVLHI
jgi:hypothetical protein